MKSKSLTYLITVFSCVYTSSQNALLIPSLHQNVGPLYNGIQLLIADEFLNAQMIWNETSEQLEQTSNLLEKSLLKLSHYNPSEQLDSFNNILENSNSYYCYKSYEREIAHFNREFITKYNVCMQTLHIAAVHLETKTFEEVNFVRNAAQEIQRIPMNCKLSILKQSQENHERIVLCVVARIGEINQRLLESSQLVLDIISEIVSTGDMETESCHAYNELKQQFDEINFSINECLNESGI